MFRDPFYEQIERKLSTLNNGDAFEECATFLLQDRFPTLSPRRGGNDAGLDGVITKGTERIQLICTTGKDVLGNLTASIKSNQRSGEKIKSCVLATSRCLSNHQVRELQNRASSLGRRLIQIFDRAGMAQRLYKDSRWAKELLGIIGDPPAISPFPITTRHLSDRPPIGRDGEIQTLLGSTDFVITGQPGSGKTHLVYHVSKQIFGRFVVRHDLGEIAAAVRDMEPKALIIDDAFTHINFLGQLRHAREATRSEYRIIATCWPGQEDEVCRVLHVSAKQRMSLGLLPPTLVKEIINQEGIAGPEQLLAELIHQAQEKPGLAVTLSRLCMEADIQEVAMGTALAKDIRNSIGKQAILPLATFALGGKSGMNIESAATLLGENPLSLRQFIEQLSAAGTIDVNGNNLVVTPARLRQALVRDVFMRPPFLDLARCLEKCPDFYSTTEVLIEARALGGTVSEDLLRARLIDVNKAGSNNDNAFIEYASIGQAECEWVLDQFTNRVQAIAPIALLRCPRTVIPMLLDRAHHPTNHETFSDGVPKVLSEWILDASSGPDDILNRRLVLLRELTKWSKNNPATSSICVRLARLAIVNRHESTFSVPWDPRTFTFRSGVLPQAVLASVARLFPSALPMLKSAPFSDAGFIADLFHSWIHPDFFVSTLPPRYVNESRKHARKMMIRFLQAQKQWPFHHALRRYASKLGLSRWIKIPAPAEALFPSRDSRDIAREDEQQRKTANQLANRLAKLTPAKAVQVFAGTYETANEANIQGYLPIHVADQIARAVGDLEPWLEALFKRRGVSILIAPFIEELARRDSDRAATWILKTLPNLQPRRAVIRIAVTQFPPESEVWREASRYFGDCAEEVGWWLGHARFPRENTIALLNSAQSEVARSVAEKLWRWLSLEHKDIPTEFFDDWQRAVVLHGKDDHVLTEIFEAHPGIGEAWLDERLKRPESHLMDPEYDHALTQVIRNLPKAKKLAIIKTVPKESFWFRELIVGLVGNDVSLFSEVLKNEHLRHSSIALLRFRQNSDEPKDFWIPTNWHRMAMLALESGSSEEDVFAATQGGAFGWTGDRSSMYLEQSKPFQTLLTHKNPRIRKIGHMGVTHFKKLYQDRLTVEKQAAIRGELI
jgi:hypothetical protein